MRRPIFSTANYEYLEKAILQYQHQTKKPSPPGMVDPRELSEGYVTRKTFPDGETYHQMETVAGKNVVIVGGTVTDSETLELYDMACHCAKGRAKSLTLVVPYFGYSTMERAVNRGEIVKAKTRARLISSVPISGPFRVIFMDLHSEGTPHYLEGAIQPIHMYAKKAIMKMCNSLESDKNFVLASTDAGRAKWVESLANDMGVECAVITKRRISGTDTQIVGINADVKGKNVIIYDDMIRTGGSLIKAGEAYKAAGAAKVYAVATHGVLPGESIYTMKASGVFEKIMVTNTHPQANALNGLASLQGFFEVFDIGYLFCKYLIRH